MIPPPQLFSPCAWTVHPLKGGNLFAVALGAWGLGAVTSESHQSLIVQAMIFRFSVSMSRCPDFLRDTPQKTLLITKLIYRKVFSIIETVRH